MEKPTTVGVMTLVGATLNITILVAGWVWTASKYTASVDMLQKQYEEQHVVLVQQTRTLNEMLKTLAVIQNDHEKYVMPHVMKEKS